MLSSKESKGGFGRQLEPVLGGELSSSWMTSSWSWPVAGIFEREMGQDSLQESESFITQIVLLVFLFATPYLPSFCQRWRGPSWSRSNGSRCSQQLRTYKRHKWPLRCLDSLTHQKIHDLPSWSSKKNLLAAVDLLARGCQLVGSATSLVDHVCQNLDMHEAPETKCQKCQKNKLNLEFCLAVLVVLDP